MSTMLNDQTGFFEVHLLALHLVVYWHFHPNSNNKPFKCSQKIRHAYTERGKKGSVLFQGGQGVPEGPFMHNNILQKDVFNFISISSLLSCV